jgi:radical SAM superfamily enzyme YgiQ (UPF0313 family)
MAHDICQYDPKIVGISVFTYNCCCCAKYLAWTLKKINPNLKIIVGGPGISNNLIGSAEFAENLKNNNVIDDFIYGDAEHALVNYLKFGSKNSLNINMSGINSNSWKPLTSKELEQSPIPDYSDYDFSLYATPLAIPINGSRGCVRQCDFCDIHSHWTKFSYRGGEHIFQEMLMVSEKYNVNYFNFTDSLINGNLKEYRILMRLIANYNSQVDDNKKLRWSSFFIFRPKSTFGDEDWELTSKGGAHVLAVGVETLSDNVRKKLGKNFTNDDIIYSFQMAQKFGKIKFSLLFFTGHPYETDEDHEFELQWWPKQIKYKDVIASVNTGTPLGILQNTPLEKKFHDIGLVSTGPNPEDWINPETNNTPQKRVKWNDEIVQTVKHCGFFVERGHDAHYIIERLRHTND